MICVGYEWCVCDVCVCVVCVCDVWEGMWYECGGVCSVYVTFGGVFYGVCMLCGVTMCLLSWGRR